MTSIVFTFVHHSEHSIIASNRIVSFVAKNLGHNIVTHKNINEYDGMALDQLFIVNGAFGFCKCLPELAELIKSARQIIWIQNDYTIVPPKTSGEAASPFRAAFRENHKKVHYMSTCDDYSSATPLSSYVNWNMLTFDEAYSEKAIAKRRSEASQDLFYYGSLRKFRERYFTRYFEAPKLTTVVSSPNDNFRVRFPNVKHIGALSPDEFFEDLGSHGLGLYLEDKQSHSKFHSPANRFYEMLSAGLPMVFQPETGSMMRRAGFNPEPYFVSSSREAARRMEQREEIGREQRANWVRDFRSELHQQFDDAMRKL